MKKITSSEVWSVVFALVLISLIFFLEYLFSREDGYLYASVSSSAVKILLLCSVFVLVPMAFLKARSISGKKLTLSKFLKEILKFKRNENAVEYREEEASQYIYSKLDEGLQIKFTKSEVDKILEYISYFTNEKKVGEDQLFDLMKKDFPSLTETDLASIKGLEDEYSRKTLHGLL